METINTKIGIFILNYNGVKWLKKTLPSVTQYSSEAKIIIIDNNSTDESIKYVKKYFPTIEVKKNAKNYGFSKGYNHVLLKEDRFNYFIIMNNDVEVVENWISPLLKKIKNKEIGIVQPKIKNLKKRKSSSKNTQTSLPKYEKTDYFDYAGAAGGYIDLFGIPFCRGRILNNIERDRGQYNDDKPIFWASGSCFMIKSKLFQELNGFDEELFMHQEEIDLCWRAQGLKQKIYYVAKSTIYHFGGGTLQYESPKKKYYNHRNNLLLIIKNLNSNFILIIILRLILDYILILAYILSGFFYLKNVFYILKAHCSFIVLVPKFLQVRKPIRSNLIYKRSVIFDYYIQRKKKFSQLKQF